MQRLVNTKQSPAPVVLALLLMSMWHGAVHADERRPDCYVVSVGVDNYLNAGKLNGCLNDARNTRSAFAAQRGKMFGKVYTRTMLDGQATRGAILQRLRGLSRQGQAGDYMVIFLSGHGGTFNDSRNWYFVPYDYNSGDRAKTALSDRQILDAADALVKQDKKVVIIIDACFSGQLRTAAQSYLARYRDNKKGGLILMMSSSAKQTSQALGEYSAFAKAFADSMSGGADLNRDGQITLGEIRRYSYNRTYQLLQRKGSSAKQDCEVVWSPSISVNMPFALTNGTVQRNTNRNVSTNLRVRRNANR